MVYHVDNEGQHMGDMHLKPETDISYFTLYSFSTPKDKVLMATAALLSVASGLAAPAHTALTAYLFRAMAEHAGAGAEGAEGLGAAGAEGAGAGAELRAAVEWFAAASALGALAVVLLGYAATVLLSWAAYDQIFTIRQKYLESLLNQDFEYYDTYKVGDIASRMTNDMATLQDSLGEKVSSLLFYTSQFVFSVLLALAKGWKLALLCLTSFPITLMLVSIAGLMASRLAKKEAALKGSAGAVAAEVLGAVRTVYAFSGQRREIDRYTNKLEAAKKLNLKKALFIGIGMFLLFFCMNVSFGLAIWFGFKFRLDNPTDYNVDTLVIVFFGVLNGVSSFGMSLLLLEPLAAARRAGRRVFHVLRSTPRVDPQHDSGIWPDRFDGNIEFKNVDFYYHTRHRVKVLENVNLKVKKGQSAALVGPSGCGKSTIIHLIPRFYDVESGHVSIDGIDVRDLSVEGLRAATGLVAQEPELFSVSVRENIRYGRDGCTDAEVEAAARQAYAHDFIMQLPDGYDTLVGERGASMSGGQKQRIAIARALVRDPRVLLLDEAASALDDESEEMVQKALDKAREGRTTVIVAHNLETIRNVDVIYVLKKGHVVEAGNHEELMALEGEYCGMVRSQASPDMYNMSETYDSATASLITLKSELGNSHDSLLKIESEYALERQKEKQQSGRGALVSQLPPLGRGEWAAAAAAGAGSALLGLAVPVGAALFGDFIGELSNPNTQESQIVVHKYAVIFIYIGIIGGTAHFFTAVGYGYAGEALTLRLRAAMFARLLGLEVAYFDRAENAPAALCARLAADAAAVQGVTGHRVGTALQAAATLAFALALALYSEWRVALVALAGAPLLALVVYKAGMVNTVSQRTARIMEDSSRLAVEAVSLARTVAALGGARRAAAAHAARLAPARPVARRAAHVRGLVLGLSRGLCALLNAAALYYGGLLVVNEDVEYSLVIKSSQALLMGTSSAASALAYAPDFHLGLAAGSRIIAFLKRPSKITDPKDTIYHKFVGSGDASLKDVSFRYPSRPGARVLRGLSLQLARGRSVALVGPSGCGKTTVLQLLLRFYDPDHGTVCQDDISLKELQLKNVRKKIGLVQQELVMFAGSIRQNIEYGDLSRQAPLAEIKEVARLANIDEFISSLPLGYETYIGPRGAQLSGGQKQRVAIARALLRRPALLLLDEATSALDTESEKAVRVAVRNARAGRTVLSVSARAGAARWADVICVLRRGRVAESGSHDELMARRGYYHSLNKGLQPEDTAG